MSFKAVPQIRTAGLGHTATARPPAAELPLKVAFAAVSAVIGVALFASATPTPLYDVYQLRWHFSTPVLTLVYATYALGVLGSLLLAGGLSDQVGRRPVLAWSLLALLASMGLFLAARSVVWLFLARGLQGLATGGALGAAGAAMLDLHPRNDARHVALVNGTVSAAGLGLGALASSLLVQFSPAPRVVPFVLVTALIGVLLVSVTALPEPVAVSGRPSLRPKWPAVPATIRGPFALAALGVFSSWSLGGLYLALGPGLAGQLLHTHSQLAGGVAVAAFTLPAALAQLAGRERSNRTLTAAGATMLAAGIALAAAGVADGSAGLFLPATALAGVGFGLSFMGALRHLSGSIPVARRSEVMSAFYVVAYLSLSLPAIAAGLVAASLGLAETFELFSAMVIVLALIVAGSGLRIRDRVADVTPLAPTASPGSTRWEQAA